MWTECRSCSEAAEAYLLLSVQWLLVWYRYCCGRRTIIGPQCHLSCCESCIQSSTEDYRPTQRTYHCPSSSQLQYDEDSTTVYIHRWACSGAKKHDWCYVGDAGAAACLSTTDRVCCCISSFFCLQPSLSASLFCWNIIVLVTLLLLL